jgi:hypothetical protein
VDEEAVWEREGAKGGWKRRGRRGQTEKKHREDRGG